MSGNLRRISYWWSVFQTYNDYEILFVISGNADNAELKKCYGKLGIRVISIPEIYPFYKVFYGKGKKAFETLLKNEKPDIVHSILVQADIIASFFKKKYNYIHISSLEGALFTKENRLKYYIYKLFYRYSKNKIDVTISLCNYTRQENINLCKINPDKIRIIYSGIDLKKFYPIKVPSTSHTITVGFLGNVSHGKLPDLFIRTIPFIINKYPHVRFLFGGIGHDLENIKKMAIDLHITSYIKFVGYVDYVPYFFKNIDIYSFTSIREGLPWSILEAMACGKAIVASPVGGVPELIKDYKTGLILPLNEPEILADKIIELIENEDLREYLGVNANKFVSTYYTIERECQEISGLYKELLEEKFL